MFALPALQLSRADIEAKVSSKRRTAASPDRGSDSSPSSSSTTQNRLSGGMSSTFQQLLSSALRFDHSRSAGSSPKPDDETPKTILHRDFGLNPRPAPSPPAVKRTSAPPEEWWSRAARKSSAPAVALPVVEVIEEQQLPPPPPLPSKSQKRQKSEARPTSDIFRALEEDPFNGGGSFSRKKGKKVEVEKLKEPTWSATAPVKASEAVVKLPGRVVEVPVRSSVDDLVTLQPHFSSPTSPTPSTSSVKLASVRGGRIDKAKRLSGGPRATQLNLKEIRSFSNPTTPLSRRSTSECEQSTRATSLPQLPWMRQSRGETMSMLLESGFFQAILDGENVKSATRPSVTLDKELPPTPGSIVPTPTELYHDNPPVRPLRLAVRPISHGRKVAGKRRSLLSQVSSADVRINSPKFIASPETISPSHLTAIPEHAPSSPTSPPPSGTNTPVATQIHLRGGSVVTVCPPELTAWRRTVYIEGPVKLPQPTIVPRKNSVASLEPFQEAIEQVYQTALTTPRQRSDEQAADDVCGFFEDFGFDEVGYTGDVLYLPSIGVGSGGSVMEADDGADFDIERFSTPPLEPEVTPVERAVAKVVVDSMAKRLPMEMRSISTEQAVRARGIARGSQGTPHASMSSRSLRHVRRDSGTLTHDETWADSAVSGPRGE